MNILREGVAFVFILTIQPRCLAHGKYSVELIKLNEQGELKG